MVLKSGHMLKTILSCQIISALKTVLFATPINRSVRRTSVAHIDPPCGSRHLPRRRPPCSRRPWLASKMPRQRTAPPAALLPPRLPSLSPAFLSQPAILLFRSERSFDADDSGSFTTTSRRSRLR